MKAYSPYVPTSVLRPYMREYLKHSSLTELETVSGVNVRTIHDIMYGKRQHVRFPTADKLLTGMGLALEWYENETLARFYAMA